MPVNIRKGLIMYYKSTRNSTVKVDSAQAIAQGISKDGGLFVPSEIPSISLMISRPSAI